MSYTPAWIRVGSVEDLRKKTVTVIQGADRPISIWSGGDGFRAVDNRCPHLGFPLHKGTLKDGILTCQWHQGRFDVCSGCTFDTWADDVPSFETKIEDGTLFVAATPRQRPDKEYHLRRLRQGLRQNVALLQAKAIVGLLHTKTPPADIIREIARFAVDHASTPTGITELAITGNLLSALSEETTYLLLLRSARVISQAAASSVRRMPLESLDVEGAGTGTHSPELLKRWLRQWIAARDRDGTERILRTAAGSTGSAVVAEMLFAAVSDQVYRGQGHQLDFTNKQMELLDQIGWESAPSILALNIDQILAGRGTEESAAWHEPIEILAPLRVVEAQLPALLQNPRRPNWSSTTLVPTLLADDPLAIIAALQSALADGAPAAVLSRHVAYAAGMRLARFATSNEVGDWFNPQHTFTFANAVHQAVKRSATPDVVRSIFHAALSVYMDRFLNVPPARLPGETPQSAAQLESLPTDANALRTAILDTLDQQSNLALAADLVVRYLRLKHPLAALVDTLALATVREDLDFHTLQVLEAAYQQAREWPDRPETEHLFVAVIRDLAAFCPTRRAQLKTATTAVRLDKGERIYEET